METIASPSYQYTWIKEGSPVDLSDTRIMIMVCTVSASVSSYIMMCIIFQVTIETTSLYVVDASNTNATLDNGIYNCQVTVTIAGEDSFTTTSNSVTIGLQGTKYTNYTVDKRQM